MAYDSKHEFCGDKASKLGLGLGFPGQVKKNKSNLESTVNVNEHNKVRTIENCSKKVLNKYSIYTQV